MRIKLYIIFFWFVIQCPQSLDALCRCLLRVARWTLMTFYSSILALDFCGFPILYCCLEPFVFVPFPNWPSSTSLAGGAASICKFKSNLRKISKRWVHWEKYISFSILFFEFLDHEWSPNVSNLAVVIYSWNQTKLLILQELKCTGQRSRPRILFKLKSC